MYSILKIKMCVIVSFIYIFFYFSISFSDDSVNNLFNVRKVKWGMTKQDVIKSEDKLEPIFIKDNALGFIDTIMNNKSNVLYLFENNRLYSVSYLFDNSDSPEELIVNLHDIISKKYKYIQNVNDGYGKQFNGKGNIVFLNIEKKKIELVYRI